MKTLFTGLVIGVTALSSGVASASIANWVNEIESNTEYYGQEAQNTNQEKNSWTSKSVEANPSTTPQFTKPERVGLNQPVTQPSNNSVKKVVVNNDPKNMFPTEDVATKHLSQVSKFLDNPSISALNSDDYLAVILLNSALVQAGLDAKLNTNNQTTQNLLKSAVGCINSKKNESLNNIATKLIADHSKAVDIKQLINSSPNIGSTYTAKCM